MRNVLKYILFFQLSGNRVLILIQNLRLSLKVFLSLFIVILFLIFSSISQPVIALSNDKLEGESLFIEHCSGCHVNGGNIIRRGKTLKLKALKRNSLDDPKAIAKIARVGIGSMSGYEDVLGEGGDQLVANWIWSQAQNAWIHG